jgi:ATP/maltotriose-dependent transcriptional regulator MalT
VRWGEPGIAAEAFERLSERTCLSGTDWALGVEARSRALLCGGRGAEALYLEAIERLDNCRITTQLARSQLVYGEWLRRQGRRAEARVPLRAAQRSFTAMDARAFAERARRELLATGEQARQRRVETRDDLTPQEAQIALLACDGLSNPEIGSRLSISPRTVEYHLRKVFGKLGIASRLEIHLVLPDIAKNGRGLANRRGVL